MALVPTGREERMKICHVPSKLNAYFFSVFKFYSKTNFDFYHGPNIYREMVISIFILIYFDFDSDSSLKLNTLFTS